MAEREEELKRLLMRVKEESEKANLKLNIEKINKIMVSSPITSQQKKEGKEQAVVYFIFLIAATKLEDACFLEGKLWQT